MKSNINSVHSFGIFWICLCGYLCVWANLCSKEFCVCVCVISVASFPKEQGAQWAKFLVGSFMFLQVFSPNLDYKRAGFFCVQAIGMLWQAGSSQRMSIRCTSKNTERLSFHDFSSGCCVFVVWFFWCFLYIFGSPIHKNNESKLDRWPRLPHSTRSCRVEQNTGWGGSYVMVHHNVVRHGRKAIQHVSLSWTHVKALTLKERAGCKNTEKSTRA